MDQPGLVKQGHPLHHGLQQGSGLHGGQGAGAQFEVMGQGHALLSFLHRVYGVVFFHHIQNLRKAGCRGDAVQVIVQIFEIHPAGFEQHFPALFGHQVAIRAAAIAQRYREILFDQHKPTFIIIHTAVAQAVAVGALVFTHGVMPAQLGAKGQRAFGVMVFQGLAAVGAAAMVAAAHGFQAVRAKGKLAHNMAPLCKKKARKNRNIRLLRASLNIQAQTLAANQRSRSSSFSRVVHAFCTSSSSSSASSSLPMLTS